MRRRAGQLWREPMCERCGQGIVEEKKGSRFCAPCRPLHRAEQKRAYAREYERRTREARVEVRRPELEEWEVSWAEAHHH
jgi:uncharacterized Zn finger protein (UPF0148 family)